MVKTIESDFTVVGGGMAGITAAVSAARLGLKVALIEMRDVLGGNSSSEHRVHYNGAANVNASYYAREGGISDEIKLAIFHKNPRYNFKEDCDLSDMALFSFVKAEKNISLFLGTAVSGSRVENGQIKEVFGRKARTEEDFCFVSPYYADASGDGILGFCSGAKFRVGREARNEYGETIAPEVSDSLTMGSTVSFLVGKENRAVPFVKPDFAYDYERDNIMKWVDRPETGRELPKKLDGVDGIWWLSVGGMSDTIHASDDIDLELKKLVYGFWDYVKNSGKYADAENYYIKWIAPVASKRESRRFVGDYVLKQQDIVEQKEFYDAVSTGGWSIDVHDPGGVYGDKNTSEFYPIHGLYNIPYRIMYSCNVGNLFLCGRIVSVSHIALGSVRVMQTLAAMAQAVGTAAYLCKKHNLQPRDISEKSRVEELQSILQRNGQYIAGLKEDLGYASGAKVSASSFCDLENPHAEAVLPLDKKYCLAVPVKNDRLDSIEIKFRNDTSERKELFIRQFSTIKNDAYEIGREVATCRYKMAGGEDGFVPIKFFAKESLNNIALIIIEPCDGVSVYATKCRVTGTPTFTVEGAKLKRFRYDEILKNRTPYTLCFRNVSPRFSAYAPENVLSGISRPVGYPNVWRAPIKDEPWIQLDFKKPIDISEIQILFNGQLENDHFSTVVETLVKEYIIEIESKNKLVKINVKNNIQVLKKHSVACKQVSKIRVTIYSTYHNPYAEIFAIKVF